MSTTTITVPVFVFEATYRTGNFKTPGFIEYIANLTGGAFIFRVTSRTFGWAWVTISIIISIFSHFT